MKTVEALFMIVILACSSGLGVVTGRYAMERQYRKKAVEQGLAHYTKAGNWQLNAKEDTEKKDEK